jgi:hypothetical protein
LSKDVNWRQIELKLISKFQSRWFVIELTSKPAFGGFVAARYARGAVTEVLYKLLYS